MNSQSIASNHGAGQALIELILSLPIFMLFILVVMHVGLLFSTKVVLFSAANSAAREIVLADNRSKDVIQREIIALNSVRQRLRKVPWLKERAKVLINPNPFCTVRVRQPITLILPFRDLQLVIEACGKPNREVIRASVTQ